MGCVTPASPDPVRMLLHDVRRFPAYTQRRVHTRVRVYAPRAAFAHMRIDAVVGAYTHRAGSRTPGCVYAQVGAYTCEVGSLDDLDVSVYTQRVRVFLGIASRYTQVGAYTPRKCTGSVPTQRVSFRKVSARGAVDARRHDSRTTAPPRSGRYCRPTGSPARHAARKPPKGCRADVTERGRGRRDVRTAQSPLATASNRHPRVALRCATGLLCQPHAAWTL